MEPTCSTHTTQESSARKIAPSPKPVLGARRLTPEDFRVFAKVLFALLESLPLTARAGTRMLLLLVAAYEGRYEGNARPAVATLGKAAGMGARTVHKHLDQLHALERVATYPRCAHPSTYETDFPGKPSFHPDHCAKSAGGAKPAHDQRHPEVDVGDGRKPKEIKAAGAGAAPPPFEKIPEGELWQPAPTVATQPAKPPPPVIPPKSAEKPRGRVRPRVAVRSTEPLPVEERKVPLPISQAELSALRKLPDHRRALERLYLVLRTGIHPAARVRAAVLRTLEYGQQQLGKGKSFSAFVFVQHMLKADAEDEQELQATRAEEQEAKRHDYVPPVGPGLKKREPPARPPTPEETDRSYQEARRALRDREARADEDLSPFERRVRDHERSKAGDVPVELDAAALEQRRQQLRAELERAIAEKQPHQAQAG